jgi:hypothetical protein
MWHFAHLNLYSRQFLVAQSTSAFLYLEEVKFQVQAPKIYIQKLLTFCMHIMGLDLECTCVRSIITLYRTPVIIDCSIDIHLYISHTYFIFEVRSPNDLEHVLISSVPCVSSAQGRNTI